MLVPDKKSLNISEPERTCATGQAYREGFCGKLLIPMADPDLQIREGGGGGGGPKKRFFFFSALQASVWSKNKRGPGPPGPLPWIPPLYTNIV